MLNAIAEPGRETTMTQTRLKPGALSPVAGKVDPDLGPPAL